LLNKHDRKYIKELYTQKRKINITRKYRKEKFPLDEEINKKGL
jgi:hypothetical protein